MNERELEARAQRLGQREAAELNVERVAARVAERLRSGEPVVDISPFTHIRWLRIAAAVVLLLGAGLVARRVTVQAPPDLAGSFVADDLTDLSADELRQVLGNLDDYLQHDSTAAAGDDLNELTPEQLKTLLQSLEG